MQDDLLHNDLSITVDQDALASFYAIGKRKVLDHSLQVLGSKKMRIICNHGTTHNKWQQHRPFGAGLHGLRPLRRCAKRYAP